MMANYPYRTVQLTSALGQFLPFTALISERPESDRHRTVAHWPLYFSLLSHFQRIIDFDAEISDRALDFRMSEQ